MRMLAFDWEMIASTSRRFGRSSLKLFVCDSTLPLVLASLSRGLDSSTIASVASDLGHGAGLVGVGHVVEPFSAAADLDERRYLEALENHIPQLDLRYVTAPGASPLGAVDQVHRCLRLPVQAGLNYVLRALFEESRQAGCGVVLRGSEVTTWHPPNAEPTCRICSSR